MKSRWLPVFALSIGPCAAYLVWAMQRGSRLHIGLAALSNIILWVFGPLFLVYARSLML